MSCYFPAEPDSQQVAVMRAASMGQDHDEHAATDAIKQRCREAQFLQAISCAEEDPSNKLLDVEIQLAWLREIGFVDVDCNGSGVNWHCSRVSSQP
jgi:hypothetical protein